MQRGKSLALDQQKLLNADTKRRMLSNLGDYYFTVGNYGQSQYYYRLAVAAGNTNPVIPARQDLMRKITSVKL